MKRNSILKHTILFLCVATSMVHAQTGDSSSRPAAPRHRTTRKSPQKEPSVGEQIRQMREDLQRQIDDLNAKVAARDAEIKALQAQTQTVDAKTDATAAKVQAVDTSVQQSSSAVSDLKVSTSTLQTQVATQTVAVEQVKTTEEKLQKAVNEPASLHYKGVTITPGGFVAGESIWRQRAMNADIYTNFNATPYMNSGQAHISEWVPSARESRFSVLATGKVPFGTITGYVETDFLSAGTTSNNLQTNSYTLRMRQAWAQGAFGKTKITGGQMWTLLTENRKAADNNTEAVPLFFDGNLHVGSTYIRQPGIRMSYAFSPAFTMALALENSQYQFSASNAPSNFFFGNAGAQPGLENQTANYTSQVAPDVILKASFDPGYGHYEVGGIVRFFRDRYYPTVTTSVGAQNDTKAGGGFVANARFPVTKKLDLGLHAVAGDGTGRYGPALLPDITVHPDGTLALVHNLQGLFSIEAHPTKKLDLFGYAGAEYAQRTYYRNSAGVLVGYGPPSGNNSGCFTEPVPTGATGFNPGVGACLGATRDIVQGSTGWVYRIYAGPAGKLQYGVAYTYLTRNGWIGTGGAPKATNNMVLTSFRYFLP